MTAGNKPETWKLCLRADHYEITSFALQSPAGTLDEVSLQLPGGAYTTFRTYHHTQALHIEDHIERLRDSASRAQKKASLEPAVLRKAIGLLLRQSPFGEARGRITLDLEQEPGTLYVTLEELHLLPPAFYLNGVKVTTRFMQRENPRAKLTTFISTAAAYRAHLPPGVNETLMVQADGRILEGLSSNFFGIRDGTLYTAEEGVLPGLTRAAVLAAAGQLAIPIQFEAIRLDELPGLEECFITSASRGVLPVVQIDDQTIGQGKPGRTTRNLIEGFEKWLQAELTEI